jgi:hypothetical protein
MDSPISANDDGVKFKPENMEREKLYHCIFKNNIRTVSKNQNNIRFNVWCRIDSC